MEARPNPDDLLRTITKKEKEERSGKLRVFFGMSAGVGKTYAMLRAAQKRRKEGVDVVIGVVETHGRPETSALLEGLPQVPKRKVSYRDTEVLEMDLDGILARKPALVLVDELAHTNAPESRHPKRWQDVVELLEAGLDVYTTMNVQHLESRKEAVELISGVPIRETVPDSLLERASQIELIDITPRELLLRLREGKVYLGTQADLAQKHFFQEDRLTALREIALRFTTEKVDQELTELRAVKEEPRAWRPSEKLLVAVSQSPFSEQVLRAAKNRAFDLGAPWIALHVDTGARLSVEDREQLNRNLSLARDLGAETITVSDAELLSAVRRIAHQKAATQIVLGRPTRRWFRDALTGGTFLERLVRDERSLDIHVIRQDRKEREGRKFRLTLPRWDARFEDYWVTFWAIAGVGTLSALLQPFVGYKAIGFLFLLSVLGVSLFHSLGPIFFASTLAALIWNFFFIPPFGTFYISAADDIVMFSMFFLAASVTGVLAHRIRQREWLLRKQTERMEVMYELVREIAESGKKEIYLPRVSQRVGTLLSGAVAFLLPGPDDRLEPIGLAHPRLVSEKELAVAKWALTHDQPAGWSTETLAGANALYLPMRTSRELIGVLAYVPDQDAPLLLDEMNLLRSVADQVALSIEREHLEKLAQEAAKLQISDQLHEATLSSISHELRTPLTAMVGVATALRDSETLRNKERSNRLIDDLIQSTERLNEVVQNLLDMSRIQAGHMELKLDWHEPAEIVLFTLQSLQSELASHPIEKKIPTTLPLIRVDFQMLEQALRNVLVNAARYSPSGSTIEVSAGIHEGMLRLTIGDEGPGVPDAEKKKIFQKFYRGPGITPGGLGLGLSIAQGIVRAHEGRIAIEDRKPKGSFVHIDLPIPAPPEAPSEKVAA